MLQNIALGGAMITIPIYLQMVLEYNALEAGLSLAPLSLTMFATAILAGRRLNHLRPSSIIRAGFALLLVGLLVLIPVIPRADAGWYLAIPLAITGVGLGLLVSQLNNYTLSPVVEERVSEAAGVNSAAGSFGLSFGLAFAGAIMLAALSFSFTYLAESSTVLTPEQQQATAAALEHDAEVMTNTDLEALLVGVPPDAAGRDHPHQHRSPAVRPPGGAADPDLREPAGTLRVVPDDAPARSGLLRRRRARPGLNPEPARRGSTGGSGRGRRATRWRDAFPARRSAASSGRPGGRRA